MLKTEAEQPEKEAKDLHETWWKEQLAAKEAEREKAQAEEVFTQLDTDQDKL